MASFESRFSDYCIKLEASGRRRALGSPDSRSGNALVADFSHNDYLGFAGDAALVEAGHAAAQRYGIGSTGSRLLSGNLPLHVELEQAIATAKGTEAALIFNSGYQANSSALAALLDASALGAEPLVFSDRLNHASLHHACQLMNVRQIRYRHNDLAHLRELLAARHHENRPKFIIAETVFGMDGDALDMPALIELADEFDAFLYLDEAHATGVLGKSGYGLASGHIRQADGRSRGVAMGTFSKALGAAGAYVACSAAVKDYLINRCTGFIYSTAPSPAVIGAVQAAWARLPELDAQRAQLMQRAQALRNSLHTLGFDTGTSSTHIIPLIVGPEEAALDLKAWLLEHGIVTSAIRPPTVPPHTARVRIALSLSHTDIQLQALCDALTEWKAREQA
ncbi:MAG: aminotransferase class I/II-fold pyridoxal phosphate-dependent enzyme [Burkholderiaceae bacterium]